MHSFEAAADVDLMLSAADGAGFRKKELINEALRKHLPEVLRRMGIDPNEKRRVA